jgi:mono/diheme cytochrome c family protein
MKKLILTALLVASLTATVVSAANNGLPPLPPHQTRLQVPEGDRTDSKASGEQLFSNICGYCHLVFGMGTNVLTARRASMGLPPESGLLANRTDLSVDYVKQVVRAGQGYMPRLTRVDITDSELSLVAEYLTRNNP